MTVAGPRNQTEVSGPFALITSGIIHTLILLVPLKQSPSFMLFLVRLVHPSSLSLDTLDITAHIVIYSFSI